ncbi:GCN5-related N-acetyltransferase [Dickeya chrysanthemi Ech1591]|uniref:GCN5-related N-acetyltransferase n=1 Tax=Dickeya chrysanthemi (strain Ech1591) TaxID=561229 RepID=C6CM57_DICC1|nr:GNAT family N-acetyltransferase [Dickeya chrysanthemi]ACT07477.1 GCN5-related N-acetyltransferase [Dickeya chrysanthemi Ech1591]WJM86210.1 GNAT family N-acetyltransferase [Dickeya chrysanthemi]
MTITLRAMTAADADFGWSLTQQMHWPHRLEDWQDALLLGEGLVAEEQGQPLGTALCWRWGERWATIGLVVVDAQQQGRGIGRRLMDGLLAGLDGYQVRLHATAAGQGLYSRLGFAPVGETHQYQCPRLPTIAVPALSDGRRWRAAIPVDAPSLTALDQQAHGLARPALIAWLLRQSMPVRVLEQHGRTAGFAALRRFGRGYTIGPVIADSAENARLLIATLMAEVSGEFVRIDSDAALGLGAWLADCGLQQVDAPVTMIRGAPWRPETGGMSAWALMTQAMA